MTDVTGVASAARPCLDVTGVRVRAVVVPMEPPVQTAAGPVASAPLVLVDLLTDAGVTGSAYVFTYAVAALGPTASLVRSIGQMMAGQPLAPLALSRFLGAHFRLLGTQGLVGLALSALDMAAWDAHARAMGVPLARALGAAGTERIQAYASLRGMSPSELAAEAADAVAVGFGTVKIKVGHGRLDQDLAAINAVRREVGDGVGLMVDYNQSLTVPEAILRARVLDGHGLTWIEEPVRADDHAGHAAVTAAAKTPIQAGENYWGPLEASRSLRAHASDVLMPDLMKIGGVTGWMATAALAEDAGLPVSSHLFVEFSSHVLAATPGRHFLEWLDIAAPVLAGGSPVPKGGIVVPAGQPGAGLAWNEDAVRHYQADV